MYKKRNKKENTNNNSPPDNLFDCYLKKTKILQNN